MKAFLNAIRRAYLWFLIRELERELHDRREMMRLPMCVTEYTTLFISVEQTSNELARARSEYNALLPVGQRKTWKTA